MIFPKIIRSFILNVLNILIVSYISDGVPSKVIADMKLHAKDKVVGVNVICLEASRYSAVALPDFCAFLR